LTGKLVGSAVFSGAERDIILTLNITLSASDAPDFLFDRMTIFSAQSKHNLLHQAQSLSMASSSASAHARRAWHRNTADKESASYHLDAAY
jgi:hypothetical protein